MVAEDAAVADVEAVAVRQLAQALAPQLLEGQPAAGRR